MAPGWYKDPADPVTQRYWDGEGWIAETAPSPAPPGERPPATGAIGIPMRPTPGAPHGPADSTRQVTGSTHGTVHHGLGPMPFPYPLPQASVALPRPHGLTLAPLSARFVARLIDILVVFALNVVVNGWLVVQYVQEYLPVMRELYQRFLKGQSALDVQIPSRVTWLELAILGIAAALWFAYEVPSTAETGQTIGKRLMHIKVVRLESQDPVGIRRAWRRWNPLGLPSLFWCCCGFGFLLQGADLLAGVFDRPLHQAIHDKSAGTVVVQVSGPGDRPGTPGRPATGNKEETEGDPE
ncbi:MAG: RDD family protein [Micromonosporaceae bacterium]|nr:RDD family protein [Micromonosporaceae bacterium]